MDKFTVARTLDEIGRYLELAETNRFKARAYERAARKVETLDADINQLVESGDLYQTPGIGKGIGPIVEEIVRTGRTQYLDELREQYPAGIFDLLRVPNLGLKKIGILHEQLGIGSIDELEAACRDGRIAKLKGFGAKTQEKILGGIAWARKRESQFLLPVGLEIANTLREQLAAIDAVDDAEIAGSVRRRLEVVRNINLVVSTRDPEAVVAALPNVVDDLEHVDGAILKGTARGEIDVLFHFTKPAEFGPTLLRATGSREFVEAFEAKAKPHGRTEEEVFERAGIPFVEPEQRETAEELQHKKRAKLVHPSDLRGTFHVHTTFSDGRNSVREMLDAAKERGYDYVGISDHSPAAFYANGVTEPRLREQHAEIARHEPDLKPMRIFRGTEADILGDGSIDYGPNVLGQFDFVVASIHSRFQMGKEEMTERILKALDDPHVTFLGHLTGRKLLSREGYTMDFDRVFERAGERGVMIEINGNPNRLDIDWRLVKRALDRGVVFSIHPDAHSTREMNAVITGTWVARKAGLSAREIFNTRPVEEVEEWLGKRKAKAALSY